MRRDPAPPNIVHSAHLQNTVPIQHHRFHRHSTRNMLSITQASASCVHSSPTDRRLKIDFFGFVKFSTPLLFPHGESVDSIDQSTSPPIHPLDCGATADIIKHFRHHVDYRGNKVHLLATNVLAYIFENGSQARIFTTPRFYLYHYTTARAATAVLRCLQRLNSCK